MECGSEFREQGTRARFVDGEQKQDRQLRLSPVFPEVEGQLATLSV